MSETKLHSLYLVDKGKFPKLRSPKTIVKRICEKLPHEYEEQQLTRSKANGFNFLLLYKQETPQNILASFYKNVADPESDIIKDEYKNGSSMLFAWDKKNLFIIPTGKGYLHIIDYAVSDFGFRFASLFKDEISIGAISQNEIGGNVYSNTSVFVSELSIKTLQTTDSVAKNMQGRLNNETTANAIIPSTSRNSKKPKMEIKSFLKFGRALNFNDLAILIHNIIKFAKEESGIDDLCKLNDEINLVSKIDSSSADYKNCLNLIKDILIRDEEDGSDRFLVLPERSLAYKEANLYKIIFNNENPQLLLESDEEISFRQIIETYRLLLESHPEFANCEYDTYNFLEDAQICAYKDEGIPVSQGNIISHISGDIEGRGKTFFIINGEFYKIQEDTKKRLLDSANAILSGAVSAEEKWGVSWHNDDDEDTFNARVCSQSATAGINFYLFHKNTPEYIEFADIIGFKDDEAYIIHVKDGFNNSMRALGKQIETSLLYYEAFKRNEDHSYMKNLYEKAVNENDSNGFAEAFPTYKCFSKKLQKCNVTYVMAINNGNRDLTQSRSITALYCLEQTFRHCVRRGVKLQIVTL